jgi:integrase
MSNFYFFIRGSKVKNFSTIYYGVIEGTTILSRRTTKITIPTNAWDNDRKTIRRVQGYDPTNDLLSLNQLTQNLLRKYEPPKNEIKDEDDCFLRFFEKEVGGQELTIETQVKYRTIVNMLRRHIRFKYDSNKLPIRLMRNLNFGLELRDFIINPKDHNEGSGRRKTRKKGKTTNNYLSVINGYITKYNQTYQTQHPLPLIPKVKVSPREEKEDTSLSRSQIESIIEFNPIEKNGRINQIGREKLLTAKHIFLFQYYCLGMRIADTLLLRTKNFSEEGIKYQMKKTGTQMVIPPDYSICLQLQYFYPDIYQNAVDETKLGDIEFSATEMLDFILKMKFDGVRISQMTLPSLTEFINDFKNRDYGVAKHISFLEQTREKMGRMVCSKMFSNLRSQKEKFIFPFLKLSDFTGIQYNSLSNLSEIQNYKLHRARVLYNKWLSVLSSEIGIGNKLTGHSARHTFSNILHFSEGTPEEISLALGHKNLSTTMKYLKRFPSHIRQSGIDKFRKSNPSF